MGSAFAWGQGSMDGAFSKTYRLESQPFGAVVYQVKENQRFILGTTPLVVQLADANPVFELEKNGYERAQVQGSVAAWNVHRVRLRPNAQSVSKLSFKQRFSSPKRKWISAASGTLALGGALFSIHHKFQADALYDLYNQTGDPSARDVIKKHDTRAGWGLALMQTGLGILTLRLVLK